MVNVTRQLLSSVLALGVMGSALSVPKVLAQSQLHQPSWLTAGVYIPPPKSGRGSPAGDSTIGQERSGDKDYKLIALVPVDIERYVDKPEDIESFIPVIEDQPTLWFYTPAGCPKKVPGCTFRFELVEYDTGKKVFSQNFAARSQSGLLGVKVVPTESSLQAGLRYRWRLRLLSAKGYRTEFNVFGNFERIDPSAALQQSLAAAVTPREKYWAVGQKGQWFGALTGVLTQYVVDPNNEIAIKDWQEQWWWMKVRCGPLSTSQKTTEGFIPLNCVDQKES